MDSSNNHGDSGWGWEPLEPEEDHEHQPHTQNFDDMRKVIDSPRDSTAAQNLSTKSSSSSKGHLNDPAHSASRHSMNSHSMKKSITSSPSFQELEKAIGATIALNLSSSSDELDGLKVNPTSPPSLVRVGTNSVAHHKIQRIRQKQNQQYTSNPLQVQAPYVAQFHQATKTELSIFTSEEESRAIILFHSPQISTATVKDACQKFGVLYYIRPEFHARGVTLLCYFDLRSAIRAKASLAEQLGAEADASVHYSIQLHASSNSSEEFRLVVQNIPESHLEADVETIFSRYGQIRTFQKVSSTTPKSKEDGEGIEPSYSYHIEFYNIQVARLAASELSASSNQIWEKNVTIIFSPLDERKQQLCKSLLSTLSKWRSELTPSTYSNNPTPYVQVMNQQMPQVYANNQAIGFHNMNPSGTSGPLPMMNAINSTDPNLIVQGNYISMPMQVPVMYNYSGHPSQLYQAGNQAPPYSTNPPSQNQPINPTYSPQTMPINGGYPGYDKSGRNPNDYGMNQNQTYPNYNSVRQIQNQQQPSQAQLQQQQQQHHQRQNSNQLQQMYQQSRPDGTRNANIQSTYRPSTANNYFPNQQKLGHNTPADTQDPYTTQGDNRPPHHNGGHGHGHRNNRFTRPPSGSPGPHIMGTGGHPSIDTPVDSEFALDIEKLQDGLETRTTVMVRNIPNKYSQQMLLDEVNEHHEGTYDFFYLPIDFKNKCNVGYCFINFLEPHYILPFIRDFHGQRWKSFNSEKVCVITFARIQGKAAMVSRFQNSSLLEKDDEYQPLLFYSSGPDRGKQEPFPMNRIRQQTSHHHHHQQQQVQTRMKQSSSPYIENSGETPMYYSFT